jgi:hypothetical protein
MRRRALALLSAAALAATLAGAGKATEGTIRLKPSPALGPKLAAWPRVVAARGDRAAQRINRALAASDKAVRGLARECRATAHSKDWSWTRTTTVAMPGPGYLSLTSANAWYCGGAYPDHETVAYVFDLKDGAPVKWEAMFPAGTVKAGSDGGDGEASVTSDALTALYRKSGKPETVDPQCKDVIAETPLSFLLWPDAKAGGLVLQPSNLPHVVAACGVAVTIPTAALRTLGANAALIDAIERAHRVAPAGKTR